MTTAPVSPDERRVLVSRAFTPAAPIETHELFAGRVPQLQRVVATIDERGQHGLLYGERGVGKTSLANVINERFGSHIPCVKVSCDSQDSFESLWKRILTEFPIGLLNQPIGFAREAEQLFFNLAGIERDHAGKAAELARFLEEHDVEGLIVIDEYDQIRDAACQEAVADLLKHLSDNYPRVTILLVGVADDVTTLTGGHPSVERCLRQIQLPRMANVELDEIITKGSQVARIDFPPPVRKAIVESSRGFPHYTHLLAKHAAIGALSDGRDRVTMADFNKGLSAAIEDASATIREQYRLATVSRRPSLYKDVLLAAALAPEDDHGTFQPRDLIAPLSVIAGRSVKMDQFFPHLSKFCAEDRGPILDKVGAKARYRYRFRNPLMKPFVVMMGRKQGAPVDEALRATRREHRAGEATF